MHKNDFQGTQVLPKRENISIQNIWILLEKTNYFQKN